MVNKIQDLIYALTFLTRLPVPMKIDFSEERAAHSMAYFPLIGILLGIILVFFDWLLSAIFPYKIVNVLILIILTCMTGGLHLDGFMDTVDGLFSGRSKEKMIEIMHDSQVGAFGVIAFFLLFLLKYQALIYIAEVSRVSVLILMPTLSRWLIVFVAYKFPVNQFSKWGKKVNSFLGKKQFLLASVWILFVIFLLNFYLGFHYGQSLVTVLICFVVFFVICIRINNNLDGLTGDIYGFVNELAEVIILLIFVAIL